MASVTAPIGLGRSQAQQSDQHSIQTPPATDGSNHGKREDDAASSSDLSDLDDRFEEPTPEPIAPSRYEDGVPVFQPTLAQFEDFQKYMAGVNPYGMKSGIVLIDPPEEWKAERKSLDEMVKTIKVRNPIYQEFHHNEYGVYTQRNMEKMRSYNLPQWKALCEQSQYQPPARRGERRAKVVPIKRKSEPLPMPDGVRRRAGRPRVRPLKDDQDTPLTPTSPEDLTKADEELATEESPVKEEDKVTPNKRRGRPAKAKPGPKPKRKVEKKAEGEKATTVAARRLHNEADGEGDINEEDFVDFDYRIHNHQEWTKERCDELEEKYWKSLSYNNPMYGADMPGSLFDDDTKCWNVAKLPNLLDILGSKIPGVNTAYLYLGMWRATFAWHLEDVDLYSINYIHFGAPKQWYSISQADAPKFEKAMRSIYSHEAKNCDQFLRHKTFLVSPSLLKNKYGVTVNKVVHREGQFVVTFPIGYHSGYNLGYNCAESVNFALESWLPYGKVSKKCRCEDDSVFIDVDWFIRRLNNEPTPEYEEWVEVTDDEGPIDLPTPPESDRGASKKRKRTKKPVKKVKRIKIKFAKAVPCALCPNSFDCDQLMPTEDDRMVHRRCALYTPETYFDEVDGREIIRGLSNIAKARLELRCNECRQKRGSCFQCSSAKCARAYHATCAAQAGVQVDIGDIAIWADGVEYRDTGLDFRCKLHRSVKVSRLSSDLSKDNHRHIERNTKLFRSYLRGLKRNDLVQYQYNYTDDIEAGVLVEPLDEDEGILVLDLLPTGQRRYIEAATILFIDPASSCLMKPSEKAKDFPKHLRGQAMSLEDSPNRKPSRLDPFADGGKYVWEEFTSATPSTNPDQKRVNGRIWHYLTEVSSETKACWTGDPAKPVHDPASNFLASVEPAKRPLIPPRRPSLPITIPTNTQRPLNHPAKIQPQFDRRATLPVNTESWMDPRPYSYKPKTSMPPPNIKVDMQSIERQREFQRQGYQQSLASQLSSHSPGAQNALMFSNVQLPAAYQQHNVAAPFPNHQIISRTPTFPQLGQYSQISPSPTDAAFPIVRRPITTQAGNLRAPRQMQPHPNQTHASADPNLTNAQRPPSFARPSHPLYPNASFNNDNRITFQAAPNAMRPIAPAAQAPNVAFSTPLSESFYNRLSTEQKEKIDREKLRLAEEKKMMDEGKIVSVLIPKNA